MTMLGPEPRQVNELVRDANQVIDGRRDNVEADDNRPDLL